MPSRARTAVAALVAACSIPAAAMGVLRVFDGAAPRIQQRGSLSLPRSFTGPGGTDVSLTGASGLMRLDDDRYAAVLDNSNSVVFFRLSLADDGTPIDASDFRLLSLAERHDYEDICPCPLPLADSVLVCEEDTPAIRAVSLASGTMLGDVPIPAALRTPTPNRGLESVAADPDLAHLWTATEEGIPADGLPPTDTAGAVVRLARLAVGDDGAVCEAGQFGYPVDPPHRFVRVFGGVSLSGVTSLASLGAGRLLVLERSACPGLPPFEARIYLCDTAAASDISTIEKDLSAHPDRLLAKRLLWQEQTGSNLEGLCLGPEVPGGGRSLLLISDNGGLGTPTQVLGLVFDEGRDDARVPLAFGAGLAACAALIATTGRRR
ncbi:MAG: esterase-like activity of phytase family protein [Planctomycetaceae bacterium]